jgi:hypothetical protein
MASLMTLVLAEGGAAERIELEAPLDGDLRLDAAAWGLAPDGFHAWRHDTAAAVMRSLLRHDGDTGWSLRFSNVPNDPDAPLVVLSTDAPFALGSYVSLREPDGTWRAWQVVSIAVVEPGGIEPPTS